MINMDLGWWLEHFGIPGVILVTNYFDLWMWTPLHKREIADLKLQLDKATGEAEHWRALTFHLVPILEEAAAKVKRG